MLSLSLTPHSNPPFQHDAQLDYYGKRLATCSSDRMVKVFDVVDGEPQRSSGGHTLKGSALPVATFALHSISYKLADTQVQSGRSLGHTQNTVTFSPPALMMARC